MTWCDDHGHKTDDDMTAYRIRSAISCEGCASATESASPRLSSRWFKNV
jgi:hypothetical protein